MQDNKYDRINTLASKEPERRRVAASVDAFLAAGGSINQIERGTGAQPKASPYGRARYSGSQVA